MQLISGCFAVNFCGKWKKHRRFLRCLFGANSHTSTTHSTTAPVQMCTILACCIL